MPLPVNVTILLSLIIFIFFLLGIHKLLTSYQKNGCEITYMFQFPQFVEIALPPDVKKAYPRYALYGYAEGEFTEQLRKMKFKGIPVLFIPGSNGSHKQGRSLASVSLRKSLKSRAPFHFNYFMIDFNEEQSAFFGGVLEDQTKFAQHCVKKILTLYQNDNPIKNPESVILIGHSIGGLIAKGILKNPEFDPQLIHLIISLATPHKYPVIQPDYYVTSYYKELNDFWRNNSNLQHINLVSIGGGPKDVIVRSDVTFDPHSEINVLTTAVPGVWLLNDHLSITWCKQLMLTIIRALFDSVDLSTKQLSINKQFVKTVFQYHLIKRHAGKKFSGSFTNGISYFEKSTNWFENLQRQFTVTEPSGLKENHYIMIRLFSNPKSEAAFIEGYNINVRDWIFACSADVVFNSIRMCETGENLSNSSEIAPVDPRLNLKRKFIYLNLHELKAKSFTHVIIRLPPSNTYMSVNVDVYQLNDRNIYYEVPKFFSMSSDTIISRTQGGSGYYSVHLKDFEYIWQSYNLKVKVLFCKTAKSNAVVSFITPWANEDQHFMVNGNSSISLSLISPKPRNYDPAKFPFVRFHLDPTCKYEVSIEPSIVGMFSQGANYYFLMLPAFTATVAILTVRQQMKHLTDDDCVLFHVALCMAVRQYYIIFQATVLGSKILGMGLLLSVLPIPDFLILQELNLDSFLLTILLYAVAIITVYILGGAIYFAIILSGQVAHKMALRFVAKAISGLFNWSEWILSALHKAPFLVAGLLISLSLSTTGAVALWLGTFFYFLKLCKMYEDYLEDWFNYSIKIIAKKMKNVVTSSLKPCNSSSKSGSDQTQNKNTSSDEPTENEKEELESSTTGNSAVANVEERKEIGSLSAIHFHITVFFVWFLVALLYIPSLLMWAKNYSFNVFLEKDPAFIPSILLSLCGTILWQSEIPYPNKKLTKATSSSLFVLAVLSIIYSSFSLYRLGYVLTASLVVVSLNQISSKYV